MIIENGGSIGFKSRRVAIYLALLVEAQQVSRYIVDEMCLGITLFSITLSCCFSTQTDTRYVAYLTLLEVMQTSGRPDVMLLVDSLWSVEATLPFCQITLAK